MYENVFAFIVDCILKCLIYALFLGDSGLTGLPGPKGDRGDGGK